MKMSTFLQRGLALVLAFLMVASNLTFGAMAEESVFCGNETHVHTDECYVSSTEHVATETTVAETVPACSCRTDTEVHSAQCALYVPAFFEQLLVAQTLKALHDGMMENPEEVYTLTTEELLALKLRAEELYAAIEEPTRDDADYHTLIIETVEGLLTHTEEETVPETLEERTFFNQLMSAETLNSFAELVSGTDVVSTLSEFERVDAYERAGELYDQIAAPSDEDKGDLIQIQAGLAVFIFDLAKGSVKLLDTGFNGYDSNGNALTGSHLESNVYIMTQTGSGTTTNTISIGSCKHNCKTGGSHSGRETETIGVDDDYFVILDNVNIDLPENDINYMGDCAFSITNRKSSTVSVILRDGSSNYLRSSTCRAGIEKTPAYIGPLVISCESGYKQWIQDNTCGHRDSNNYSGCDGTCGYLLAAGGAVTGQGIHSGAGIGTGGQIIDGKSLSNLTIAGGKIDACGGAGGKQSSGGGAGIGNGSAQDSKNAGPIVNFNITGGTINAVRGSASASNIGGGYRSKHVELTIYGGTISATEILNHPVNSDQDWLNRMRAAAIGGGGGGYNTASDFGATVTIYGGYIDALGQYGAAIGAGAGGSQGGGSEATVNIHGGTINAKTNSGDGLGAGAAIGSGGSLAKGKGGKATVNIFGGTITANSTFGAAIGGGGTQSSYSTAVGGEGIVNISGGSITVETGGIGGGRAKAGIGGDAEVNVTGGTINAVSIGGGESVSGNGGDARVTVNGENASITLTGLIGGGNSSSGNGGDASVTVHKGYLLCAAIGGGNSETGNGGNVIGIEDAEGNTTPGIYFTGGTIRTGEIGGGTNNAGDVGYASALVEGGDIRGQFVMKASVQGNCSFTMTGGTIHDTDLLNPGAFIHTQKNGGAVYMDDPNGTAILSGDAVITKCGAENGGAVYMTAGTFTLSETASITDCGASVNGGAVYLGSSGENKGTFVMTGGTIVGNSAENSLGGAIYLAGGDATVSGGVIGSQEKPNTAKNGGGVYLAGGALSVSGEGTFAYNTATENGGGAYLNGGTLTMTGGSFANNAATQNGGGAYLNGGTLTMSGGSFANNTASQNGGGAYLNGGALTMTGGTFTGNEATLNGGGAYISGGDFVLNGENATFSENRAENGAGVYLTGGEPNLLKGKMIDNIAEADGGGIYIDQHILELNPTGAVTITSNEASRGAGIFIGGTNGTDAGFSVNVDSTGTVDIFENIATADGGGVCISNGYFNLSSDNITLQKNQATNGGAVAVLSGDFDMSGGTIGGEGKGNTAQNGGAVYVTGDVLSSASATISGGSVQYNTATDGAGIYVNNGSVNVSGTGAIAHNTASRDGGGIYVNGGEVALSGGHVDSNTAQVNGGGIAVNDGNIVMSGGYVNNNTALTGSGGGMYVTSSEGAVHVKVYSGHIEGNTAAVSGGAVGLRGGDTSNIEVQVGVNLQHTFTEGVLTPIDHDPYTHEYCPVIKNNTSSVSGGAFYITGGAQTTLNMYCLEESGNNCPGDADINNVHLSDFLMVEGGKVTISTAADSVCDDNDSLEHDHAHGYIKIAGSVHVAGGTLDLFGSMDNPAFEKHITVDLTKQEDHYHDHRDHSNSIKLSYHENFDFHGVVDSTQTAIDLISGQEHTISDSLYKHEGYEIYGWNIDKNASTTTPDGWFDNGKTYVFIRTESERGNDERTYYVGKEITLYAIWEPNGYTVRYDPNVPENEDYTGEKMDDQRFTYNQAQDLRVNTYGRVGYLFGGWTYIDDNKVTQTLTDGQKDVMNLTKVKGGTVVLKAIWTPCTEHNIEYTVTQETAKKAILTKTCTLCHRTGTVILTASDAVYDKAAHPAGVVCSESEWFEIKNTEIEYAATKIDKSESVVNPAQTVNAGNYTATVTAPDGTAASVTYQIAKATQPAPAQKPTYTEPVGSSTVVTVHPIQPNEANLSPATGLPAEYSARYYEAEVLQETSWHKPVLEDGVYQDVPIDLVQSLTYYFIYVRYAGDDNYWPSDDVMADGTFLFEGKIKLTFIVDDGISYRLVENKTGGLVVDTTLSDQYYLIGGALNVTLEGEQKGMLAHTTPDGNGDFVITKTTDTITEMIEVTVRIGNTKKMPSVISAVEEKQVFEPIAGNSAQISRDSAYTVLYTVKNFDGEVYNEPALTFGTAIPVGTTIILQSRNAGTISYWSYKADAQTTSIPLDSFKRMGNSSDDVFSLTNGDHDLQFVVDFSRTAAGCSGDTKSKLETRLSISKKIVDAGAPDLSEGAPVSVTLGSTSFELSCKSDQGLTHTLTYSFTPDGLAASKWDNRELALVISGSGLPLDAVISATVNGTWHICRPYSTGQYIVPIGGQYSGTIELTLKSDMFPEEGRSYALVCQLYAARSIADDAPLDGAEVCNKVNCAFVAPSREYAVKVTEAQGKHLFNSNDSITVTVDQTVATGYMLKVQLQHKDQGTDVYVNTGRRADVTGAEYTFSLNGSAAGSYRVVAIVERDDGLAVAEIPYYFIIQ